MGITFGFICVLLRAQSRDRTDKGPFLFWGPELFPFMITRNPGGSCCEDTDGFLFRVLAPSWTLLNILHDGFPSSLINVVHRTGVYLHFTGRK